MIVGNRVKYFDPRAYPAWTGVVKSIEASGHVTVKWDPSYTQSEGLRHHPAELRVVDPE